MKIRRANTNDAAAIQSIYAPYVSETIVSFEETPPDVTEVARRIETVSSAYPFLVAEDNGHVVGYAYASQHRSRSAYRTSVDVAVYIAPTRFQMGIGRALYGELFPRAANQGYHAAFAGIALPNEASVALHKFVGFEPVGIYRQVGRKFGAWVDVGWWQRLL